MKMHSTGWAHSKRKPAKPQVKDNGFRIIERTPKEPLLCFYILFNRESYRVSNETVAKCFERLLVKARIKHTRGSHV